MKRFVLSLSLLLTLPALGQFGVQTVRSMAELATLLPSPSRPSVQVLGTSSPNDGGGGEYVWMASSVVATNANTAIAYPYGSAAGRWIRRIVNQPELKSAQLTGPVNVDGTLTVNGTLTTGTNILLMGSGLITTTNLGSYPGAVATVPYVDIHAPTVAPTLAALQNAVVGPFYRYAFVLNDTGGDGSAGDWYFDPDSLAADSPVVVRPTGYSTLTPGRWFKR